MPDRIPTYRPPGGKLKLKTTHHRPVREHDQIGKTRFASHRLWRKFRLASLAQNPLCVDCKQYDTTTEATQVHHIVKRADDMSLAFEESNCMALCASCHSKRTNRGE